MAQTKNPWGLLAESPPYVLEADREAIEHHSRTSKISRDPERFGLHTELPPTPFLGDPSAPVVLLNLNPGFNPQDLEDYTHPQFREAALKNLTHRNRRLPFFPIDPRFSETSSYRWWWRKLHSVVDESGLDAVSKGLFCVQAFPYHSREFASGLSVPSQVYTVQLLSNALARSALIIGMRARRHWEAVVPALLSHERAYWLRNPRNPTLSAKNVGASGCKELLATLEAAGRR